MSDTTAAACDHPSTLWVDDQTGWRCYDCDFVVGHIDPAPTNDGELAAAIQAASQPVSDTTAEGLTERAVLARRIRAIPLRQLGWSANADDIADALLASDWLAQRDADLLAAVQAERDRALVTRLRAMATAEFDQKGPRDARGAAIWDVAAFIDEEWKP